MNAYALRWMNLYTFFKYIIKSCEFVSSNYLILSKLIWMYTNLCQFTWSLMDECEFMWIYMNRNIFIWIFRIYTSIHILWGTLLYIIYWLVYYILALLYIALPLRGNGNEPNIPCILIYELTKHRVINTTQSEFIWINK